jgi:hypothetical protein
MSYRDPNYFQQAARAADHQERIREGSAAREMVKEAHDVDYNESGEQRSVVRRILAGLRRRGGDRT